MANKHDEAIKVIERAISDAPHISDNYWQLALVYASKEDRERAFEFAKKAFDLGYKFSQDALVVAFPLFDEHGVGHLVEPQIGENLRDPNLRGVNRRLIEIYVEYLNKNKRYQEADDWNRKFLENK